MLTKKLYEQATGRSQKSNVIAYQIRQSFRPGEITAEEANRIGYELASRFLKGKHAFIVATHTDREHMLIVQDAVWGRVTANREAGKSTRYFVDEFHLLLKEEQTAAYSVEIWKRFRKWGGIPTGLTQNCKDLLSSPEVSNIFENSDMIIMLNQANGDRQILAKQLNISPHQLSYVTHSGSGEGLLFYGNTILPFVDHFPHDLELYKIMTTKLSEVTGAEKHE